MAKIKIEDLPIDQKINSEEMRNVIGGMNTIFDKYAHVDNYGTIPYPEQISPSIFLQNQKGPTR